MCTIVWPWISEDHCEEKSVGANGVCSNIFKWKVTDRRMEWPQGKDTTVLNHLSSHQWVDFLKMRLKCYLMLQLNHTVSLVSPLPESYHPQLCHLSFWYLILIFLNTQQSGQKSRMTSYLFSGEINSAILRWERLMRLIEKKLRGISFVQCDYNFEVNFLLFFMGW